MYWLRWHYHVKDIAGAPYKIKKKRKTNKTTESPTVSSRADNGYTVQYGHDRLVIVERRPEKYSLQLATERRQRRYIPTERPGRAAAPPSPLLAVPNVTAQPSTASVPITVLLYDGPLLCGFNVVIKGLRTANRGISGKWPLNLKRL